MNNKSTIQEDLQKIHSAVNQIDNQRITLVTAAITIIAVVLAWFIPKPSNNDYINNYIYAGTILIFFFLFIYFIFSRHLRYMQLLFVEYLKSDNKNSTSSQWEKHIAKYQRFNKIPLLRGNISHEFIYLLLGIGILLYPNIYRIDDSKTIIPWWIHYLAGALYCGSVIILWLRGRDDKTIIRKNWQQIDSITNTDNISTYLLYEYPFLNRIITLKVTKKK